MGILIFALVLVVLLILGFVLVDLLAGLAKADGRLAVAAKAILVLIAIVLLLQRFAVV
jgi:hypothetical protein